jgi:uncharacterized tellurite resistance protein B-like protein
MLSFFKKATPATGTALEQTLRTHLRDVDEDALHGVVAVAGLVVKIAMEDGNLAPDEEAFIRTQLATVGSLGAAGVDAIVATMRAHASEIASVESFDYARWLATKRDREFRLAVLKLLVGVAQSHEGISREELDGLGRIAVDLGLTSDDLTALLAD